MRKNKLMQFVITGEQYDRIKNLTSSKGFFHMADYIRFATLEKDLTFERKFEEIHKAIMIILEVIKNKKEK